MGIQSSLPTHREVLQTRTSRESTDAKTRTLCIVRTTGEFPFSLSTSCPCSVGTALIFNNAVDLPLGMSSERSDVLVCLLRALVADSLPLRALRPWYVNVVSATEMHHSVVFYSQQVGMAD
jgi:hypothetical protein